MLRQINSAGRYCHQAKLGSNLRSSLGIARRPGDDSDDTRRVGLRDGCQVMRRKSGGASTKAMWLGHRGHLSEVRRIGLGRPVLPVAGDVEGERQRADNNFVAEELVSPTFMMSVGFCPYRLAPVQQRARRSSGVRRDPATRGRVVVANPGKTRAKVLVGSECGDAQCWPRAKADGKFYRGHVFQRRAH